MAWQKGMKSPNPGGRPKRGTGLTDLLREIGQQTKDGRKRAALLAERVWDEALKGEQWACRLIYDRLEGLPVARHEKDELVKVEVSYVEVHRAEVTGPHPAQEQVIRESSRWNLLACGRRWGKTVLGMDRLIEPALQGFPCAWFAPNYRYLAETWRTMLDMLQPVLAGKNEQERRIELIGGGAIECWSLDSPDAGRGRKYKRIVVDEAAIVPDLETAWQQSIRATLTDLRGDAWFLSTPKGVTGYFHTLYQRGLDPDSDWRAWQMPTSANPYIHPDEIEDARRDLSELAFSQEYEARFVSWEGAVFRRSWMPLRTFPTDCAILAGRNRGIPHGPLSQSALTGAGRTITPSLPCWRACRACPIPLRLRLIDSAAWNTRYSAPGCKRCGGDTGNHTCLRSPIASARPTSSSCGAMASRLTVSPPRTPPKAESFRIWRWPLSARP